MTIPSTENLRKLTAEVNADIAEEFELLELELIPPKLSPAVVRAAREIILAEETPIVDGPVETPQSLSSEKEIAVDDDDRYWADVDIRMANIIKRFASDDTAPDDVSPATLEPIAFEAVATDVVDNTNGVAAPEPTPAAPDADPPAEPAVVPAPSSLPTIPDVQIVPARVVNAETLTPQPATLTYAQKMAAVRVELRDKFFSLLRDIAVDGVMPSAADYNERKPDELPGPADIMNRLGYESWQDVAFDVKLAWTGKGRQQARVQPGTRK